MIDCLVGMYRSGNMHNNNNSNVYNAVIMAGRAIARVHPVHLMNVERRQDPRPSILRYFYRYQNACTEIFLLDAGLV